MQIQCVESASQEQMATNVWACVRNTPLQLGPISTITRVQIGDPVSTGFKPLADLRDTKHHLTAEQVKDDFP